VLGNGDVARLCRMPSRSPVGSEGCASTRKCWPLQPARPRAHDKRCPSEADRGNDLLSARLSRAAGMDGLLCGESRSGPDSLKLGWHGLRKECHVIGCAVPWGPNPAGHTCQPGSRRSGAVLADRIGRRNSAAVTPRDGRRSGARKHAVFDEAAGGGGPGTFALGGESNPINPRTGARQRASEAGSRPWFRSKTPGTRCAARRARDHAPTGPSRQSSPGDRGRSCIHC